LTQNTAEVILKPGRYWKLPKLSIFPRGENFYLLFDQSAQNAVKIALQLRDMIDVWENVRERVGIISDFEHQGDAITHQIMTQLYRSFITPIDREDIAQLAHALDDITDFIQAVAETMYLYKVDQPTGTARELVDLIVEAVQEVEKAVSAISVRIERKNILQQCIEINRLENLGDQFYRSLMSELFASSNDIAALIKWREIYGYMEGVLDRCEDVANILEGICIKYA